MEEIAGAQAAWNNQVGVGGGMAQKNVNAVYDSLKVGAYGNAPNISAGTITMIPTVASTTSYSAASLGYAK